MLPIIDGAGRLRMAGLDGCERSSMPLIGVILIGMLVLEKRVARCPQFYSRISLSLRNVDFEQNCPFCSISISMQYDVG